MRPNRTVGPYQLAVHEHAAPGPGPVPRVVLVHGTMDRATSLAKVARRLPDLDVVRYDRRGYGDSRLLDDGTEVPPAGTIEDQVADLLTVLDERPAVVVGHSMGGTIALAAAARYPDLSPAVAAYESPRPWAPWWPTTSPGARVAGDADIDLATAAERFMRRMIGDAQWERLPASSRTTRQAEGAALVADMTSIRAGTPAYDDAALVMPVVAARGSLSIDHHARAAEEIADLVPDGHLISIDGARHGAHLTHPDEFAALVRQTVVLAGQVTSGS
jgi:pimeloyl-ACP methyl ester carboxylesterase